MAPTSFFQFASFAASPTGFRFRACSCLRACMKWMTTHPTNTMLRYPNIGYTTAMISPKPSRLPAHASRQIPASSGFFF